MTIFSSTDVQRNQKTWRFRALAAAVAALAAGTLLAEVVFSADRPLDATCEAAAPPRPEVAASIRLGDYLRNNSRQSPGGGAKRPVAVTTAGNPAEIPIASDVAGARLSSSKPATRSLKSDPPPAPIFPAASIHLSSRSTNGDAASESGKSALPETEEIELRPTPVAQISGASNSLHAAQRVLKVIGLRERRMDSDKSSDRPPNSCWPAVPIVWYARQPTVTSSQPPLEPSHAQAQSP